MEFVISNAIRIHPMALVRLKRAPHQNEERRERGQHDHSGNRDTNLEGDLQNRGMGVIPNSGAAEIRRPQGRKQDFEASSTRP